MMDMSEVCERIDTVCETAAMKTAGILLTSEVCERIRMMIEDKHPAAVSMAQAINGVGEPKAGGLFLDLYGEVGTECEIAAMRTAGILLDALRTLFENYLFISHDRRTHVLPTQITADKYIKDILDGAEIIWDNAVDAATDRGEDLHACAILQAIHESYLDNGKVENLGWCYGDRKIELNHRGEPRYRGPSLGSMTELIFLLISNLATMAGAPTLFPNIPPDIKDPPEKPKPGGHEDRGDLGGWRREIEPSGSDHQKMRKLLSSVVDQNRAAHATNVKQEPPEKPKPGEREEPPGSDAAL